MPEWENVGATVADAVENVVVVVDFVKLMSTEEDSVLAIEHCGAEEIVKLSALEREEVAA